MGKRQKKTYRPGEKAQRSGQYERITGTGRKTGTEATVTRGEPLPPTPKSGQKWRLKDPTKHKSSK